MRVVLWVSGEELSWGEVSGCVFFLGWNCPVLFFSRWELFGRELSGGERGDCPHGVIVRGGTVWEELSSGEYTGHRTNRKYFRVSANR